MAPWHTHALAGGPEAAARATPARPACLRQASSLACVHFIFRKGRCESEQAGKQCTSALVGRSLCSAERCVPCAGCWEPAAAPDRAAAALGVPLTGVALFQVRRNHKCYVLLMCGVAAAVGLSNKAECLACAVRPGAVAAQCWLPRQETTRATRPCRGHPLRRCMLARKHFCALFTKSCSKLADTVAVDAVGRSAASRAGIHGVCRCVKPLWC